MLMSDNHPIRRQRPSSTSPAIRMLFDWLIVGQVMTYNPAAATRGLKHAVDRGQDARPAAR